MTNLLEENTRRLTKEESEGLPSIESIRRHSRQEIESYYSKKLVDREGRDPSVTTVTVSLTQEEWKDFSFKDWYKLKVWLMADYPNLENIAIRLPSAIKMVEVSGTISFDGGE